MSTNQERLSNLTEAEQKPKNPFINTPDQLKGLIKWPPDRKLTIIVAALAIIIIALIITLSLNVLVGGRLYSRSSETLDLRGVKVSAARFETLTEKLPECYIRWDVPLSCGAVDSESEDVRVTSLTRDDVSLFNYFTKATHVDAVGCEDYDVLALLRAERPELGQTASVQLDGKNVLTDIEKLDLAGRQAVDVDELAANADKLYCLKTLDVTGCGLTKKQLDTLLEAFPDTLIKTTIDVCGIAFSTDVEEIDLSEIPIENPAEIEAVLPFFRNLKKVVMCDCGISNEDMDALNKRHEDVRFVWRVYFSSFNMRTDETAFCAAKYTNWEIIWDNQTDVFKYCTDLIGLDLGHMRITDLSFLQYMPHMQYLIIVDGPLSDISDIGKYCPELKYLEIFKCPITDLSPLLECKELEDLNICYTWVQDVEPLLKMTWLDRLWFCGNWMTAEQQTQLMDSLADTEINMKHGGESTGGTWRYHEHYYTMRDAFGMYYMPGGTNGVDENGVAIING